MKFYVYVEHTGEDSKNHIFVANTKEFADSIYNPNTMAFTGVAIEASSVMAAKISYDSPGSSDLNLTTLFWTDEPRDTFIKRNSQLKKLKEAVEAAERASHKLHAATLAIRIAEHFSLICIEISNLSRHVRMSETDSPELTPVDIYDRLKETYIEQLKRLPYIS